MGPHPLSNMIVIPARQTKSRLPWKTRAYLEGLIFDLDFVVVLFCCSLFCNWESLIKGTIRIFCTYNRFCIWESLRRGSSRYYLSPGNYLSPRRTFMGQIPEFLIT